MVGTNLGKCEWVWEEKLRWLNPRWPNSRWQNSRWLPSSSWVRMNKFESDWISLSQSQSGVRVFLSESERRKQGVWIQDGRIQDGCHHQVESEWMSEVFLCKWWGGKWMSEGLFCANGGNQSWQVWVSLRGKTKVAESQNSRWQNSRWLPSSSWVRMNKFESDWISLSQSFVQNGWIQDENRIKMAEFKMAAIIKLNQNELVWVRLN